MDFVSRTKFYKAQEGDVEDFWELGDLLGAGAHSVVRAGVHLKSGAESAVKILDKTEPGISFLVENEVRLLTAITEVPSIVKLLEIYETKEEYFLCLELIKGESLIDKIIRLKHYSERNARNVVRQMLICVSHLHSAGFIHRDLKLDNLMVCQDENEKLLLRQEQSKFAAKRRTTPKFMKAKEEAFEEVDCYDQIKMIDFGLSAHIEDSKNELSKVVGTPDYVAPEVLECQLKGTTYGKEIDMWAVGVIAFNLLCGSQPFSGADLGGLYAAVVNLQYSFHHKQWEKISEKAKDFIRKILVKEPEKRLSVEEALNHPWITEDVSVVPLMETVMEMERQRSSSKHATYDLSSVMKAKNAEKTRQRGGSYIGAKSKRGIMY